MLEYTSAETKQLSVFVALPGCLFVKVPDATKVSRLDCMLTVAS